MHIMNIPLPLIGVDPLTFSSRNRYQLPNTGPAKHPPNTAIRIVLEVSWFSIPLRSTYCWATTSPTFMLLATTVVSNLHSSVCTCCKKKSYPCTEWAHWNMCIWVDPFQSTYQWWCFVQGSVVERVTCYTPSTYCVSCSRNKVEATKSYPFYDCKVGEENGTAGSVETSFRFIAAFMPSVIQV